jgi:hypothetical protein
MWIEALGQPPPGGNLPHFLQHPMSFSKIFVPYLFGMALDLWH